MTHYVDLPAELNSDTLITCDDDVEISGLITDKEIINPLMDGDAFLHLKPPPASLEPLTKTRKGPRKPISSVHTQ